MPASVAWATEDELTPAQRVRHRPGEQAETPSRPRVMSPPAAEPEPPVDKQEERVDPEILIPAFVSPAGRDSLGRAVAVARDRVVQHEREALPHYLRGTYRDPYAATGRGEACLPQGGLVGDEARTSRVAFTWSAFSGWLGLRRQ